MTRASPFLLAAGLAISLVGLASACNQGNSSTAATVPGDPPITRATVKSGVSKVVFVGMMNACDCTRKRVNDTFLELQAALADHADIPVVRYQIDVEPEKVAPYRQQKPVMVLPALYFVDENEKVLNLLQGEVTEDQILAALGAPAQR